MKTTLYQYPPQECARSDSSIKYKKFIQPVFCALTIISLLFIYQAKAQTLPAGFSQVLVANGLTKLTVMAVAPDGRIFVAQQTGQLRIIKNGSLLAQPFVTLSVNSTEERGLLGIAFDPNFISNNYIYLYYTLPTAANNRISRFTANGDVVLAGSETVVLDLDSLSSSAIHNGGTLQFGPDGKLYVGIGENQNSANAQNLDTYLGKILRINSDGTVPPGNPYTTGSTQRQRVWSYGLRNPYTMAFQPGTGRLFVNDVGQGTWEEIDEATTSNLNFGWPGAEGNSGNPAYTNPIYTYTHGTGSGLGCAITGGTFFNPLTTNYPSSYTGKYFFVDDCGNWIDMLTLTGSSATRTNFASAVAPEPIGIVTGTDGNLYFLSRINKCVYKIVYTAPTAPVITSQPQNVTVAEGNSATFSVTATGTAPLSYQWLKNGTNVSGATNSVYTIPSVTSLNAGTYSVVVTNIAGTATSDNATLTVTVTTVLNPVADAYVRPGSFSNNNYGSNTALSTKTTAAAKPPYQTFLRFDISSLSANLSSVKLRLYGHLNNTTDPSATVQVFNVNSQTWQENTITYANRPAADATVLASANVNGTTYQYYEWDLTQPITSLRNSGASYVSLLVKNLTVTTSRAIFNSKEKPGNRPQLVAMGESLRLLSTTSEELNLDENSVPAFSFTVYPNPATNDFTIRYSAEFKNKKLHIADVNGKLLKELLLTGHNVQNIPVNDLQEGLYLLFIEINNRKYSQKIVIRK